MCRCSSSWKPILWVSLAVALTVGTFKILGWLYDETMSHSTNLAHDRNLGLEEAIADAMPNLFAYRTGKKREQALREYGGNAQTEEAVARGLKWIAAQQKLGGRWRLEIVEPKEEEKFDANEIAATAMALLPLLAAGHTHQADKNNPYDTCIDKGLKFLIQSQDNQSGYLGGTMYGHGLATIAICEAYGMTTDPALRKPAQDAINLIIAAQHEYGAWRYLPEKTPAGDLSIFGWQCMALKTGQAAGLDVPRVNIARAKSFIEGVCNKKDEGYCYVANGDSTPTMTAVGVLCRQHQENWGPSHPRLRQAVDGIIKTNPPNPSDVYYTFHATQVMFHDGGNGWNAWNDQMRSFILEQQERNTKNANFGSFHPDTDRWGRQGGRLMVTSLNLLTLQVYYRHTHLSKNPYGGIW